MTTGFRWHPEARLFNALAQGGGPRSPLGTVVADGPEGLAQAIGLPAFRVGALDQPAPAFADQPVFETLTSGSTGSPRRILRTQASWLASFAVNAQFGIGPGTRVAVLGRLVQSLALYGAVEGLHLGAEVHLLDLLRPDRQRQALAYRRITHLYATPAQLRQLGPGVCPDLRLILVGGSKLDPALRAAVQAMAPKAQVKEFYGAAETSFITLADETTPEGSVGRAYPGVEVTVEGAEVWVKSPYLFIGYASDPGSARWRDGWLSVGEIGRLEGEYLFLHGRAGRMATVADQNVFPEEIESFLAVQPGVKQAAVLPVADAQRGAVLVAFLCGDPAEDSAIMAALRGRLGPLIAPKRLIWLQDWPKLPSGKADLLALEGRAAWRV
ncbi:MAG: long-chain fatty acid--CoA ligase [Rhodobacteraceae bacterium]|nr:long-chain fatty acid--CoA ligase [Paracoccaceae bacterium]